MTAFHIEQPVGGREEQYLPFYASFAEGAGYRKTRTVQKRSLFLGPSHFQNVPASKPKQVTVVNAGVVLTKANPYCNAAARSLRALGKQKFAVAELEEIAKILEKTDANDELTTSIKHWHQNFSTAVDKAKKTELTDLDPYVTAVLEEYLSLLHELTKDFLTFAPLEKEEAVLGSDGRTYNKASLQGFEERVSEEYKGRSPLDLENPAPFTFEPHPVLSEILQWLEKVEAPRSLGPLDAVEILFQDVQSLRSASRQRLENKRERALRFLAELEAEEKEKDKESFALLRQIVEEGQGEQKQRIALKAEEEERERQKLLRAVHVLQERVTMLEERKEQLDGNIGELKAELKHIQKDHAELQVKLQETRQAIKERNERAKDSLWKSLAIVAACIAANWMIQQALGYLGGLAAA